MDPYKLLSFLCCIFIFFIGQWSLKARSTHVFVRNYTPLSFQVCSNYNGSQSDSVGPEDAQTKTIAPFDFDEHHNMVLTIDRFLPKGEHIYTVTLTNGLETLILKQKLISKDQKIAGELGISLELMHMHDPWFMNGQAKERHEHTASINGHDIVIAYYAYECDSHEDVEYVLYEKHMQSTTKQDHARLSAQSLIYCVSVPMPSSYMPVKVHDINILQQQSNDVCATLFLHVAHKLLDTRKNVQSNDESMRTILHIIRESQKRLPQEDVAKNAFIGAQQTAHLSRNLIDCIAKNQAWLPVVESTTTNHFWVQTHRKHLPIAATQ